MAALPILSHQIPRPGLTQKMELAGRQAELLRQRAEALKKFAQRYKDSSTEQSQYTVPHQGYDPPSVRP